MNINQYNIINDLNLKINILEGQYVNNPIGIILHVHGLGSHFQPVFGCLDEFKNRDNFFCKFNYKSVAFEFSGHGKSEGERCCFVKFDDLVNDLEYVVKEIEYKHNLPIFLFGESMGCAVIFKYCITKKNNIKGVIFMAPLCGIDDNLKPHWIIKNILLKLADYFPKLQLISASNDLSHAATLNKDYIKAKNENDYFYNGKHRLSTGRELIKISEWIDENAILFDKPILLFHGTKDYVTSTKITQKIFEKIKSTNKELYLLEGCYHILLLDNFKDSMIPEFVMVKVINWIQKV